MPKLHTVDCATTFGKKLGNPIKQPGRQGTINKKRFKSIYHSWYLWKKKNIRDIHCNYYCWKA